MTDTTTTYKPVSVRTSARATTRRIPPVEWIVLVITCSLISARVKATGGSPIDPRKPKHGSQLSSTTTRRSIDPTMVQVGENESGRRISLPEDRGMLLGSDESSINMDAIIARANDGDVESQYVAGLLYFYGRGKVREDYSRSTTFFRKAALQGDAKSQRNLAILLVNGLSGSHDTSTALAWFRRASLSGDAHAMWMLGQMLYENKGLTEPIEDTDRFKRAFEWFEKSGELGNENGIYRLGIMFEYGLGTPQDFSKAAKLYREASEKGNHDATYYLALMYTYGRSPAMKQDMVEAGLLFKQCAAAEHPGCLFYMGRLCLEGQIYGNDQIGIDHEMAQYYLIKAVAMSRADDDIAQRARSMLSQLQRVVDRTQRQLSDIQRQMRARGADRNAPPPSQCDSDEFSPLGRKG